MILKANRNIYLSKIIRITLIKRNTGMLLQIGTKLTGIEKESLAKILFLKNVFLKKRSLTDIDIIDFAIQSIIICPRVAQHVITTSFPHYHCPLSIIREKMPNITFLANKNSKLNWDQILSAAVIYHRQENPIFKNGQIISLSNKKSEIFSKDDQAYKNTHQHEPDYLYKYMQTETGLQIWTRYYDCKTGHISPNKGHIFGTSDPLLYETLSEELLKRQEKIYSKIADIRLFFDETMNKEDLSWGEKNLLFQNFILKNMQNFPQDINPSFIFKTQKFSEVESLWKSKNYKLIEGNIDLEALKDKASTELTIAKVMCEKNPIIWKNYSLTHGHSSTIADICKNLWKDYFY